LQGEVAIAVIGGFNAAVAELAGWLHALAAETGGPVDAAAALGARVHALTTVACASACVGISPIIGAIGVGRCIADDTDATRVARACAVDAQLAGYRALGRGLSEAAFPFAALSGAERDDRVAIGATDGLGRSLTEDAFAGVDLDTCAVITEVSDAGTAEP
jgi:hypothetical protein